MSPSSNPEVSPATICPTCGTTLSEALAGLCLKCLGRLGFGVGEQEPGDSGQRYFGDYELLGEIARGGMGVVYRARQLSLNRVVALKAVLHGPFSSPDFVRRFRTEAEAAASLRHPNIVSVYEVGEHDGHHFLSMEYVEGQNFAEVAREQPLPARRAAAYLKTMAEAVEYAHERGVLHRDLKPSNVLLDLFDQPQITDFGLAKVAGNPEDLTITGQVLGSPSHMPPEQALGKSAPFLPQSDVYSLGAVLYQLLTCRPPFQGETIQQVLLQVQTVEPIAPRRLNPSVPADLQTICLKCLQKEPARRYRSARELADDLDRFLAKEPIRARPVSVAHRAWLWMRRRPVVAGMSAALLIAVAVGLAGIFVEWRRSQLHAQGELKQRLVAETLTAKTRLNLYAADVALAAQEIQNDDYGLARHRLAELKPKAGEADLRGFEWRYLWNLCRGSELATLTGHEWIVTCAAFSPDGKCLVTGSMDGTVQVWDWANQRSLQTFKRERSAVSAVSFTADGAALMVAGVAGVEMRDTDRWKVLTRFGSKSGSISREGTLLATADSGPFYYEPPGEVVLWDWRSGQRLRRFDHPGHSLSLSPDGHRLAVARPSNGVDLFNADTGELLRVCETRKPVWSLSFSPDGRRLLTAGWSSEALVWTLADESPPRVLSGHRLTVWSAVFSPDGKLIATTGSDQTVRLWDAANLQMLAALHGHDSEVWCAAFSPDSRLLATGGKDCTAKLWSAQANQHPGILPHENSQRPIFSPDSKKILVVRPGTAAASELWSVRDRARLASGFADGADAAGFSTNGQYVLVFQVWEPALEYWTLEGKNSGRRVALETGAHATKSFDCWGTSPEGEYFSASDSAGMIDVWNAQSGRLLRGIKGPTPPLRNLVLGPMARHLAACVERETAVHLYEVASGQEHVLEGHRDFVSGLAFSPDGALLATGSMDGTIRLWRTLDGQLSATLPGHMEETTDLAFSPDGQTLASVGHAESLKLWHLPTLREVYSKDLPRAGNWLQFSPDGRRLAVATEEQKLLLLEAPE